MALDLTKLRRPERSIANCTVTDISSGAYPRDVTVKIPGVEGEVILAKWYGQTPLAINDLVRIWVDGESQIARIAGETFSSTHSAGSVDSSKISKVHSPDLTIEALTADNSGDVTIGSGDVTATAGDYFSDSKGGANGAGVFERNNIWNASFDTHFNSFTSWTWDSVTFDGAPSTIDTSTYASLLRLMNDSIVEDHFAYRTVLSETIVLASNMIKGVDSYIGLRCDNENDDDYFEMRIIDGTNTGTMALERRHRVSGGSVTTATIMDNLEIQFVTLRLLRNSPTDLRWYYAINSPIYTLIASVVPASVTWTTIRYGLIFGQRSFASNADRAGLIDWLDS